MEWSDDAILLSTRPHAEAGAVVSVLTRTYGRHAGLIRSSHRLRGVLEPGTHLLATWRARLREQLGAFVLEPTHTVAAGLLDDPLRLAALVSACALVDAGLPEREPMPAAFDGLASLLELLPAPLEIWAPAYVMWEIGLLGVLGFGLHLDTCAATGSNDALIYVSPRSGKAVSASAGEPFADKLLPLPAFLLGKGLGNQQQILDVLKMTGHFLERVVFHALHIPVPAARARLVERLAKEILA